MKHTIHHKEITASTNTDARSGKHGDVFTADLQTAGRGRLDHKWSSQPGMNLMMSAVLDVSNIAPDIVATLPLAVGLAVRETIARFLPKHSVMIKWPNDVLVEKKKICGILCERNADNVIAGIGINVKQTKFAPEIAGRATSLAIEGSAASVNEVRDLLLDNLDDIYARWIKGGFAALCEEYSKYDLLKGKQISVRQTDNDPEPVSGICSGVMPDGTLSVAGVTIFAGEAHIEKF